MSTHYDGFCTDCGSWTAVHDGRCGCGSGRVALPPAGFSIVHKDEIHAPSVERAIAVLNEYGGKPCGPAELWTDEQRKFYDAGQTDATSSSAAALRELMKEVGRG